MSESNDSKSEAVGESIESVDSNCEVSDSELYDFPEAEIYETNESVGIGDRIEYTELYEPSGKKNAELYDADAEIEMYTEADSAMEQADDLCEISIDIGNSSESLNFSVREVEAAYDKAESINDEIAMERLSAIYDLAVFKDELELEAGDSSIPQIAGKYGEIKDIDPKGFEAHHMPAKSSVIGDINEMPAISMEKQDHAMTDSYKSRSNHAYESFIPGGPEFDMHKYEVGKEINNGNFVNVIKSEVFNIRDRCGNKYDGAIGKYLDTVAKNIAKSGIPIGRERE